MKKGFPGASACHLPRSARAAARHGQGRMDLHAQAPLKFRARAPGVACSRACASRISQPRHGSGNSRRSGGSTRRAHGNRSTPEWGDSHRRDERRVARLGERFTSCPPSVSSGIRASTRDSSAARSGRGTASFRFIQARARGCHRVAGCRGPAPGHTGACRPALGRINCPAPHTFETACDDRNGRQRPSTGGRAGEAAPASQAPCVRVPKGAHSPSRSDRGGGARFPLSPAIENLHHAFRAKRARSISTQKPHGIAPVERECSMPSGSSAW